MEKLSIIKPINQNSYREFLDEKYKLPKVENINEQNNYLYYLDANSLYPTGMVQELPTGEMEWCTGINYERTQLGKSNPGFFY